MENVWAYLVVSTAAQKDTLDDQRRWAEGVARENGWNLTDVFEGHSSGRDGPRSLLVKLLSKLNGTPKAQRPRRVLMIRLDRVGRGTTLEVIGAIADVYNLGTIIHTREDGDITLNRTCDSILPIMRALTGGLENEARKDKSRATYDKRRQAGKDFIGSAPGYGFNLVGPKDDKHLEIFEPEAAVVRRAFEMRAQAKGFRTIARELHGWAPNRRKSDGTERTTKWHMSSVMFMIHNRNYRGRIVSEELWDRANAVQNPATWNEGKTKHAQPLSGAIKCTCGYAMRMQPSNSNWDSHNTAKRYYYRSYFCDHPEQHPGEAPRRFRAEELEAQVPAILRRLHADEHDERQAWQQLSGERERLQHSLSEANRYLGTLERRRDNALDLHSDGTMNGEELRRRLESIRAEEDETRGAIARDEAALDTLSNAQDNEQRLQDLVQRLADLWPRVPHQQQRQVANVLARAVGGIIVTADKTLQPVLDAKQNRLQIWSNVAFLTEVLTGVVA